MWLEALADADDPSTWLKTIGEAYLEARAAARVVLVDLWIQALTEAADDPEIRRALRRQVREVHTFVAELIRRAQAAGGIQPERDPEAEAWIFISLGLLTTIDRRLGGLVGDDFEDIIASRREWMTGRTDERSTGRRMH
jgi:uncharacterized alpha-E superfamily protein